MKKVIIEHEGKMFAISVQPLGNHQIPHSLMGRLYELRNEPSVKTVTLPDKPDECCSVCGKSLDVPIARLISPDDGWYLRWACSDLCEGTEIMIPWPFSEYWG